MKLCCLKSLTLVAVLVGCVPAFGDWAWKVLGSGDNEKSCTRYEEKCNANIMHRNGAISLNKDDDSDFKLILNGESVATLSGLSVTIQEEFSFGEDEGYDVFLIAVNTGGMACPMKVYLLEVSGESDYALSDAFGTCSDYYEAYTEDDEKLVIGMPVYLNPMHANDIRGDEEVEEVENITIYEWKNAKLRVVE